MPRATHVSVHLSRFAVPLVRDELGDLAEPPEGTTSWRAFVDVRLGDDVLAERRGEVWAVVGLHSGAESADASVRSGALFRSAGEPEEAWHGSFDPISHRGAVNWLAPGDPGPIIEPGPDSRGGPLAVITTAGYELVADFDLTRAQDFAYHVDQVRPVLRDSPGNVTALTFASGGAFDGVDAPTFTVWRDTDAIRDAAHRPGLHKTQMDRYKEINNVDRTSFTRLRLRTSTGTWDGLDPFDQAAGRAAGAAS